MAIVNRRFVLAMVALSFAGVSSLGAQTERDPVTTPLVDFGQVVTQPAGPPPTPRHTGIKAMLKGLVTDVKNLPSRQNLFVVAVGSGLALAVHPADDNVNSHLVGSGWAKNAFTPGKIIGATGTLLGTAATVYAVGRIKDQPKVSHVGMDLIRSLAITEGLTQALKYSVRR